MTPIVILVMVLAAAGSIGLLHRRREGRALVVPHQAPTASRARMLGAVGVGTVPAVLHFSADWCGPCAAVRRVVAQVLGEESAPAALEVELDIDANPALAKELGVLSLPTTFIFDAMGVERFRIPGVPTATALRDAVHTVAV